MQTVRTKNNGHRFIEQYEWTIGVCITVQIGERGTFTDVQIGERGKQRVNEAKTESEFIIYTVIYPYGRFVYLIMDLQHSPFKVHVIFTV